MTLMPCLSPSIAILIVLAGFAASGRASIRQHGSRHCAALTERLFGAELRGAQYLFDVNKDYALELRVGKHCEITKIEVAPKYFWEGSNPIWKEPTYRVELSEKDYQDIMAKVEQIRSLGSLVRKGTSGSVTNSKLWLLDQYEKAFVERGVLSWSADQTANSSAKVHVISIYFMHRLRGKIEDKELDTLIVGTKRARLRIRGRWYLTTEKQFVNARVGKYASLMVAGPMS